MNEWKILFIFGEREKERNNDQLTGFYLFLERGKRRETMTSWLGMEPVTIRPTDGTQPTEPHQSGLHWFALIQTPLPPAHARTLTKARKTGRGEEMEQQAMFTNELWNPPQDPLLSGLPLERKAIRDSGGSVVSTSPNPVALHPYLWRRWVQTDLFVFL